MLNGEKPFSRDLDAVEHLFEMLSWFPPCLQLLPLRAERSQAKDEMEKGSSSHKSSLNQPHFLTVRSFPRRNTNRIISLV